MWTITFTLHWLKFLVDTIDIFHYVPHLLVCQCDLQLKYVNLLDKNNRHCRWLCNCNNTFWTNDYYLSDKNEVWNAINLSNTSDSCSFYNPLQKFIYSKWLTFLLIYYQNDSTYDFLRLKKYQKLVRKWKYKCKALPHTGPIDRM